MSSEALQHPGHSSASSDLGATAQTDPLSSGLAPDLQAQLEAKLGRPLTPDEAAVLSTPPSPPGIVADKLAMPAVARELYDLLSGVMNRLTLGIHGVLAPRRMQPPISVPSSRRLKIVIGGLRGLSLLSVAYPLGVGIAAYDEWLGDLALHHKYPTIAADVPFPLIAVVLGSLFFPLIFWQSADALSVSSKVAKSDLLERLVDGDPSIDEIYEHTPIPWRWLAMGGRSKSLRGRAVLLANYLDWFVGPRHTHFRWYWAQFALSLTATPILAILEYSQSGVGAHRDLFGLFSVLFMAFEALLPVCIIVLASKSVFCRELQRQLLARFGAISSTAEDASDHTARHEAAQREIKRMTARRDWRDAINK